MPDRVQLRSGVCLWLSQLQRLVAFVATLLLLTLSTPWHWKLGTLLALSVVFASVVRHNARHHPHGRLMMRMDGTLLQERGDVEMHGMVEGAWVSRWLCVIHWATAEDNRQRHSLVCASNNRPEDFRRMLVLLRLGPRPSRDALSW